MENELEKLENDLGLYYDRLRDEVVRIENMYETVCAVRKMKMMESQMGGLIQRLKRVLDI